MHVFLSLVCVTKVIELHICLLTKSQLKLNHQHGSNCMLSRRLDSPVSNCLSSRVAIVTNRHCRHSTGIVGIVQA